MLQLLNRYVEDFYSNDHNWDLLIIGKVLYICLLMIIVGYSQRIDLMMTLERVFSFSYPKKKLKIINKEIVFYEKIFSLLIGWETTK